MKVYVHYKYDDGWKTIVELEEIKNVNVEEIARKIRRSVYKRARSVIVEKRNNKAKLIIDGYILELKILKIISRILFGKADKIKLISSW